MKQTRLIMGMPITVEIVDKDVGKDIFKKVFDYFRWVDKNFSPFKKSSQVSKINSGQLQTSDYSFELKQILKLAEKTKQETDGFFNVWHDDKFDPSGIVKGWAIQNVAKIIQEAGFKNYYVDAGGDIQACGLNKSARKWQVGIRNPLNTEQIVKVVALTNQGIATSGSYLRGNHVYDPISDQPLDEVLSISVVGPNVFEADRFATAAFAMGKDGINFIANLKGFEGYMINKQGQATYSQGFQKFII